MNRRLKLILAAVFITACVGVHVASEYLTFAFLWKRFAIGCDRGVILIGRTPMLKEGVEIESPDEIPGGQFLGFHFISQNGATFVGVPIWLFVACYIAILTFANRKVARHLDGAIPCKKCGYDLRATPDRCPECGAATGGSATGNRAD